jgi:hypothetical protein
VFERVVEGVLLRDGLHPRLQILVHTLANGPANKGRPVSALCRSSLFLPVAGRATPRPY